MRATDVLAELNRRGVELAADGDRLKFRPQIAVTPELRAAMAAHKLDLLHLLAYEEREIQWRVDAMRGQYVPGVGFHFLVARREFVDAPGCCLSCGDPLQGRKHRCPPCARAAEIVVNEVWEGLHPAPDHQQQGD